MNLNFVFTMGLKESNELLVGKLSLLDGKELIGSWPATSGLAGYQTEDHFWVRGKGLIPRTIKGKRDYTVDVKGRYPSALKGIEGMAYRIFPDPIRQVGPGGGLRSEVMIHRDANWPGSSGCIVLRIDEPAYKVFNDLVWKVAGKFDDVPLDVIYFDV